MKAYLPGKFLRTAALFAVAASTWTTSAAESAKAERPKIYDESADGSQQVTNALAAARKGNKVVLLQFGANWCGWCHKLHKLFASDKAIREELKAEYVVAMIDVDKGHNKDLVAKHGAERLGLPCLVVLDAAGK